MALHRTRTPSDPIRRLECTAPCSVDLSRDRDRFRSLQTSFNWQICEFRIQQCSNTVGLDVAPNATGEATITTVIDGETVVSKVRIQDE